MNADDELHKLAIIRLKQKEPFYEQVLADYGPFALLCPIKKRPEANKRFLSTVLTNAMSHNKSKEEAMCYAQKARLDKLEDDEGKHLRPSTSRRNSECYENSHHLSLSNGRVHEHNDDKSRNELSTEISKRRERKRKDHEEHHFHSPTSSSSASSSPENSNSEEDHNSRPQKRAKNNQGNEFKKESKTRKKSHHHRHHHHHHHHSEK